MMVVSLFFLAAPFWNPLLQAAGVRILTSLDAVLLFGASGLFYLLGRLWFPSRILNGVILLLNGVSSFSRKHTFAVFTVLSAALLLSLYAVNQQILHAFLSSADEHSCYFLAECLLRGRLWVEPHPLSEFFNVVHVGNRAGKWFSVYPPGWPLIWAAGIKLQIVDWLNPVMVTIAAGFFFLAGRLVYGAAASALGLLIIVSSPFFLFTGASYFSHGTCLLMAGVFLYSYLKWMSAVSGRDRFIWAVLMAFAVGYGLMTRYLTMAAITAPFLLYHFAPLLLRRRTWRREDWAVVLIVSVFFILVLWQNYEITGKPFKAPNKFDKSWERLGFRADYTPLTALNYLVARFFYLMDWLPGAWIGIFFLTCFKRRGKSDLQKLIPLGFWLPALAYFFYYSWGGNQWGPRYYYEGILFLGLAAGAFLHETWRSGDDRLRKGILCVFIFAVLSNVYLFTKQARFHGEASAQRKALYSLAESRIQRPSIVFLKGFLGSKLVLGQEDAVRNSPFLDGNILYVHDLGEKNAQLMAYYPEHDYYQGSYDQERLQPVLVQIESTANSYSAPDSLK